MKTETRTCPKWAQEKLAALQREVERLTEENNSLKLVSGNGCFSVYGYQKTYNLGENVREVSCEMDGKKIYFGISKNTKGEKALRVSTHSGSLIVNGQAANSAFIWEEK